MNEKMQYAEMLEIPVNTCNITYKPASKRKRKKASASPENAKEQLIDKINATSPIADDGEQSQTLDGYSYAEVADQTMDGAFDEQTEGTVPLQEIEENYVKVTRTDKPKQKKKFKFGVIGAQVAVICLLLATIFVTNALLPNSGINTLMHSVFKTETVAQKDQRLYSDFKPVLPVDNAENITVSQGVMNFGEGGSFYSPCDGKVTSVLKEVDGTYTLEIEHSENFKTVFSGLDYAYCSVDDKVYSNIPVGYVKESGATMCFYDGLDTAIIDYSIEENSLKWMV